MYMLFTGWEVRIGRNCPRGRGPKYRMKLPTIPPGLADKIVKRPPAPGTNQIAGFGEWRKKIIFLDIATQWKLRQVILEFTPFIFIPKIRSSEHALIFSYLTELTRKSWVFAVLQVLNLTFFKEAQN